MGVLVWLRNDLRLRDNPALFQAAREGQAKLAVYLVCDQLLERHQTAPARLDLIRRQLVWLEPHLARLNIPLVLLRVPQAPDIAPRLVELTQKAQCDRVYFNAEYPLDELNRDRALVRALRKADLKFERFHDRVILPPGELRNGQGQPYQVFTAFKRRWRQLAAERLQPVHPIPATQNQLDTRLKALGVDMASAFEHLTLHDLSELWPAGEDWALERLASFATEDLADYQQLRDQPALEATSRLSPYLAMGSLSPRQCLHAALNANRGDWHGGMAGAQTWIDELIWRDFYQHVTVDFPQVCKNRPLQIHTDAFPWRYDKDDFDAWCQGQTGIPIVDAAMHQLLATGWMHNRLRMLVAMFLTKNLRIDWRWGESWFMSQLVDGDFAANNGGWQWSASTGTDAAPYFRIFNPVTQSQRFDPQGTFIRKYLPALRSLSAKAIHQPPAMADYPAPIVDLKASRKETIALFKALNQPAV